MTGHHRYLSFRSLNRRPVLIAMLVYAMAYGTASFALWREASNASSQRKCEMHRPVEDTGNAGERSATPEPRAAETPRHLWI